MDEIDYIPANVSPDIPHTHDHGHINIHTHCHTSTHFIILAIKRKYKQTFHKSSLCNMTHLPYLKVTDHAQ